MLVLEILQVFESFFWRGNHFQKSVKEFFGIFLGFKELLRDFFETFKQDSLGSLGFSKDFWDFLEKRHFFRVIYISVFLFNTYMPTSIVKTLFYVKMLDKICRSQYF